MKVNVRGHLWDLLAFQGLPGQRRKHFAKAPPSPIAVHPVNVLASQLHPDNLHLVITDVRDETRTTRTFRLGPDPASETRPLPYFRAGQYLSLKVDLGDVRITRPYSISSAPFEALGKGGFYEVTMRRVQDGFLTEHVWERWKVGTPVVSSGPAGFFYHEPLRDAHKIVGLAGGSGITPFRSMARGIVFGGLDAELLLLYGSSAEDDIPFYREFQELEGKAAGRFRAVHVLSCDVVSLQGCEQGFITAELMRKHADVEGSSFFVCGPQAMYRFVEQELPKLKLPRRRVRWEAFGEVKGVASHPGFPPGLVDRTFRLRVHVGGLDVEIPARATETVLVAMERADLAPPAECRSGECGYCRSLLAAGQVYVVPESDRRRAAARERGFIHPCSAYPVTDLEVRVPRAK
jgi:ferredoxin-NADP reductase